MWPYLQLVLVVLCLAVVAAIVVLSTLNYIDTPDSASAKPTTSPEPDGLFSITGAFAGTVKAIPDSIRIDFNYPFTSIHAVDIAVAVSDEASQRIDPKTYTITEQDKDGFTLQLTALPDVVNDTGVPQSAGCAFFFVEGLPGVFTDATKDKSYSIARAASGQTQTWEKPISFNADTQSCALMTYQSVTAPIFCVQGSDGKLQIRPATNKQATNFAQTMITEVTNTVRSALLPMGDSIGIITLRDNEVVAARVTRPNVQNEIRSVQGGLSNPGQIVTASVGGFPCAAYVFGSSMYFARSSSQTDLNTWSAPVNVAQGVSDLALFEFDGVPTLAFLAGDRVEWLKADDAQGSAWTGTPFLVKTGVSAMGAVADATRIHFAMMQTDTRQIWYTNTADGATYSQEIQTNLGIEQDCSAPVRVALNGETPAVVFDKASSMHYTPSLPLPDETRGLFFEDQVTVIYDASGFYNL